MNRHLILPALLLAAIAGCSLLDVGDEDSKEPPVGGTAPKQEVYFERSYVNFAWGYQLVGFFIDHLGDVFWYDHSDQEWIAWGDTIAAADLREKLSHGLHKVGTVPRHTLFDMCRLIEAASEGPFTPREHTGGADQGTTIYWAYRYQPEIDAYLPVVLEMFGGTTQSNLAPEAVTLWHWLEELLQGIPVD